MSLLRIQSKRVWLILMTATAVIFIADAYKTSLGVWGYLIGYPTALALLIFLGIRQQWKDLPPEAQATSQKTMLVSSPYGLVSGESKAQSSLPCSTLTEEAECVPEIAPTHFP